MKESKFIELVNLYVDHQISPAEAALLEAEIQRSADRRRVYRQYCQIQKACTELSETFKSETSSAGKAIESERAPARLALATYAMGFAAVAACVALVVVNRPAGQHRPVLEPTLSLASAPSTSSSVSAEPDTAVSIPAVRPALQPVFAGLVRNDSGAKVTLASNHDFGRLDWMNQVRLQRVSAEDLRFESQHTSLQAQDLMLRSTQSYQGQVETTAFIFPK